MRQLSVVLAVTVALLLAACGGQSDTGTTQQEPGQAPQQEQEQEQQGDTAEKDTLVIANAVEIPTFDVQQVLGIDAIVAIANLYDRLLYLDADDQVYPWLATDWEVSEDGRTWTFHMRDDAVFPDGTPVTSQAVAYSIERAIGPDSPSSLSKTYLQMISKVETPDDYTVVLHTEEPFAPMLRHVGHQIALAILNPNVVEAHNNDLTTAVDAGSGMYKLVEWKRGEHLILERNEDWWGPKPYFKRIIYRPVSDPATRVLMLETGEVDVATVLPNFEVERLRQDPNIKIIETDSIRSMMFLFNWDKPPVDNVLVRQAINHAVDVQAIIDTVLNGYGKPATSPIAPNMRYHVPVHNYPYDPDRARELLRQAGVEPGTKIVIQSPQGRWPGDAEISQAVAGFLNEVGFDAEVRIFGDWAQFLETRTKDEFHLIMTAWAPGSLDADGTFNALFRTGGNNNYGGYSSPEADDLIVRGVQTLDGPEREAIYRDLQELLNEDLPYLLLHNSVSFSGVRANICGVNVRGDDAHIIKDARVCD
ncbi:MAG TPA: ABC transporter substrate-binding protein [Bacillota bacterium]